MGKIIILDENTANKIAAGEVIERPASVVKEMVENSIDAGATSVSVEIKNGGVSFIRVTDNGSGIAEDDAEIAFERHATSKIRHADDLELISTMGFRGEALASIAAVSTVELTTKTQKSEYGTYIKVQAGNVKDVKPIGCPVGTTFVIRDLFYNTPARFKFLKKDTTEAGYVSDIISRIALANPQVSFRLISNGSSVLHTPGNNDLLSAIFSIYGKEIAKEVLEINYSDKKIKITGYAGKPEIARANRSYQSIYINKRYIKSKVVTSAIDEAYKTLLMKNKFAFIVLNLEINPVLVDVNVHPTKMEVRFSEEQDIFRSVYNAVGSALSGGMNIKSVQFESKDTIDTYKLSSPYPTDDTKVPKKSYTQQKFDIAGSYVRESSTPYGSREEKSQPYIQPQPKSTVYEPAKPSTASPVGNIYEAKNNTKIKEEAKHKLDEVNEIESTRKSEQIVVNKNYPEADIKNVRQENFLTTAKIIGQAFSTYILMTLDEELIVMDQHAAHERIMYESIKQKYQNNESLSQMLISPVVIELTHQEIKLLEERQEFFKKLGYTYENFGNNSIIIRSVPYIDNGGAVKETFLQVIDQLMGLGSSDYNRVADDVLYTIACKAAVKANKKLDEAEIKGILEEMNKLENPYTCPHGRPTVIKITKYELEKMFKRVI